MDKAVEVTFKLEMTLTVVDARVAENMLRSFEKFATEKRGSMLSGYPALISIQTSTRSVD